MLDYTIFTLLWRPDIYFIQLQLCLPRQLGPELGGELLVEGVVRHLHPGGVPAEHNSSTCRTQCGTAALQLCSMSRVLSNPTCPRRIPRWPGRAARCRRCRCPPAVPGHWPPDSYLPRPPPGHIAHCGVPTVLCTPPSPHLVPQPLYLRGVQVVVVHHGAAARPGRHHHVRVHPGAVPATRKNVWRRPSDALILWNVNSCR